MDLRSELGRRGLLTAPVGLDELLLLPGERADLMIRARVRRRLPSPQSTYNRGAGGMGMVAGMGSMAGSSSTSSSTIATFAYSGQADHVVPLPQKLVPSDSFHRRH